MLAVCTILFPSLSLLSIGDVAVLLHGTNYERAACLCIASMVLTAWGEICSMP